MAALLNGSLLNGIKNVFGRGTSSSGRKKAMSVEIEEVVSPMVVRQPVGNLSKVPGTPGGEKRQREASASPDSISSISSATTSPSAVPARKTRREDGLEFDDVDAEMGDAFSSPGASMSEPTTEPACSPRSEAEILQLVKEDLEKVMHEHLARVKSAVVQANNALEERGVFLSAAAKKKLIEDSVRLNEQAVTLLKGLRVKLVEEKAGALSRKHRGDAEDGASVFVGNLPRAADEEDVQALFPRGAQVERRSRGKGKFVHARVFLPGGEVDKVLGQDLMLNDCKLRVALWEPRGNRRRDASRPNRDQVKTRNRDVSRHEKGDPHRRDASSNGGASKIGTKEEMLKREKNSSVVLKSLSWDVKEEFLRGRFKEAIGFKVLTGEDGRSHGMGFLDFKDEATATEFIDKNQGMELFGRPVILAYSLRKVHPDGGRSRLGGAGAESA